MERPIIVSPWNIPPWGGTGTLGGDFGMIARETGGIDGGTNDGISGVIDTP